MTDPNPPTKPDDADRLTAELLALRQHSIGVTMTAERLLEALGHPVKSAVTTRRERRNLTRRPKKRKL